MNRTSRTRKPPEGYRRSPTIWYVKLYGEYIGYTVSDVLAGWQWFLAVTLDGQAVINPVAPDVGYHNSPRRADNGYHTHAGAAMALALASGKLDEPTREAYTSALHGTPQLRPSVT